MLNTNLTTVTVKKDDVENHKKKSKTNGWNLKSIEEHNSDNSLVLITYERNIK